MSERMKVAVIGVGSMGANHVRVYANRDDVELVGIVDPDAELGGRVARRFSTTRYDLVEALFAEQRPDAVSIAVPTSLHPAVATYAMKEGAHVLLEKPIAGSIEDGLSLADEAKKCGVKLLIGHIERYNPAVQFLHEKIMAGEAGDIYRIEVERAGPFPPRIQDTGVSLDLAVHDLDIVSMLVGSLPQTLYSEKQQFIHKSHEDSILALLRYPGDILATLNINWTSPTKRRLLKVYGTRGMFQVNYITQELRFYENADQPVPDAPWENPGITVGREIRFANPVREPLGQEIDWFLQVIREDIDTAQSTRDAIHALQLAQLLVSAAGEPHMIKPVGV